MANSTIESREERWEHKSVAEKVLRRAKELEKKKKTKPYRLDEITVVFCKDDRKFNKYKENYLKRKSQWW